MRVLAAMTLLFAASCTFDYGPLRGTAGQGEGGVGDEVGARDGRDAMVDRPLLTDIAVDAAADIMADVVADAEIVADAAGAADVSVDSPGIGVEDAAPEEDGPPVGGAGGTGPKDAGGTGGATSSSTGGVGGSVGGTTSRIGGTVNSGGGGAGGVSALGGTSTSTSNTGGKGGTAGTGGIGGTTTTGGVGGTSVDAGPDGPALDVAQDESGVDGAEADTSGIPLVIDTLHANPGGGEFTQTSSTSSPMKLVFYSVNRSVTLHTIEQYLSPPAVGSQLHWVVYRSDVQTGTNVYTLIQDAVSSSNTGSDGYQSSPPMDVVLDAGAYYALGVYWQAIAMSYWFRNSGSTSVFPIPTSFGSAISGFASASPGASTTSWSSPTGLYSPQRLTTR